MMGQQKGNQDQLFYCFNLDEHIPANQLLRAIDGYTGQPTVEGMGAGAARKDEEFHGPDCNTGRRRIPAAGPGVG